jgi:hypothetical protein
VTDRLRLLQARQEEIIAARNTADRGAPGQREEVWTAGAYGSVSPVEVLAPAR